MPENYTPGYSSNAINFMMQRSAQTHAVFFIPHLHRGMKLLDCGCGPGTITLGLAELISPGTVTGIDREISQIQIARENAAKQSISNAEFIQGSIYDLPFSDNSFDAVFSHALFEHLQEPAKALQEINRVLKPGGKVGVRSPDWGEFSIAPLTPELNDAIEFYKFLHQQNGGNPYMGRNLGAKLQESGFRDIQVSSSYERYKSLNSIAEYLALRIEASANLDRAVEKGWTDERSIAVMAAAWRQWSQHPEGCFAQAWSEAIGQKG